MKEKYLLYVEFKTRFDRMNTEDQSALTPHLDKLFQNWNHAIKSQTIKNRKSRFRR